MKETTPTYGSSPPPSSALPGGRKGRVRVRCQWQVPARASFDVRNFHHFEDSHYLVLAGSCLVDTRDILDSSSFLLIN